MLSVLYAIDLQLIAMFHTNYFAQSYYRQLIKLPYALDQTHTKFDLTTIKAFKNLNNKNEQQIIT